MFPPPTGPIKIIIADHLPDSGWEILKHTPNLIIHGPSDPADKVQFIERLSDADALIVRSSTIVGAELLDAAPNLKVVARAGARLDNIDIEVATRRGVMVINVPEANVFAVVEHAFGMLLAILRDIPRGFNAVQKGQWPRFEMIGTQIYGKSIGIIGFGRLGREAAIRAQAFGLHVLVYDPFIDLSFARERGVEIVGYKELLSRSDILLPMTALTTHTRHILNAEAFSHAKLGAVLVNCVNAGLVDEPALLAALEDGIIWGAALDTFDQEPPTKESALPRHPQVLAVPHLNQNTIESQRETGRIVVTDVLNAIRGIDYRNVVNLPFTEQVPYPAVKPYIRLAKKLGKLQGQLAEGWITHLEVELQGEGLVGLIRPVAAVLLTGMLLPVEGRAVNWVSAPVHAAEQGIVTAQAKNLLRLEDYPNLVICRIHWKGGGERVVAGALFANGDARLVHYDGFHVDADPEGHVLILENDDIPGVIGKVGTLLGVEGINIANWRYGRETQGGRAVSFINVDSRVPGEILISLMENPEIHRARLVFL